MSEALRKGLFVIVSGFSGSGKGTVLSRVFEKNKDVKFSVSATTRKPRTGEVHGVHYFFMERDEFKRLADDGGFAEYTETYGNCYGTPLSQITKSVEAGQDIILELDVKGTANLKSIFPDAVAIFLTAPSLAIVKKRLIERGTENSGEVALRIEQFKNEIKFMSFYDYLVINDDIERCADDIITIIRAEHLRRARNQMQINKIADID
ncbi:MAG: guanylate kinase [Clostridiaceae bacterium]|jgi:guanylate kinase|nr:guanylate kinase [Clostridiaceae bacterium]